MVRISETQGDITGLSVDAIVNAANSSLLGGGGVDGAIHRAAGPSLLAACREVVARQGGCATGDAVITPAGELDADWVIHTVGPVWNEPNAAALDRLLASCYRRSLSLADENDVVSIAFPNISTGVYRYPKQRAGEIAVGAVGEWIASNPDASVEQILFVCFDAENLAIYSQLLS